MSCLGAGPFDVVVFLLDDLRFDQVAVLSETTRRLEAEAVVWPRAYVTVPLCCPERASFLSGGWWPQETGVLSNELPDGGATLFPDARTMPVRLQEAGYATALFGKYLNDYELMEPYVPPGWTTWDATLQTEPWQNFDWVSGSSNVTGPSIGVHRHFPGYVADWQRQEVNAFLDAHPSEPVFAYVSFRAPHYPHVPSQLDVGAFSGTQYRGRAYEEADVSDKPSWVRAQPLLTAEEQAGQDQQDQEMLETLLSTDRAMASIIDHVVEQGRADRTVFVLTSDNGQLWGEHRLFDKGVAYEESVRIPLWLSNPAFAPRAEDGLAAMNLDLAATVQELAGLSHEGQGQSLVSVACGEASGPRDHVLLQGWPRSGAPMWAGVVTSQWKYVEWGTGERELYDLLADPYEESNCVGNATLQPTTDALSATLDAERGLAVLTTTLPTATLGVDYRAPLETWGGRPPVVWSVHGGALPPGVALNPNGSIEGLPAALGTFKVALDATDSSVSGYSGAPEHHLALLTLPVVANPVEAKSCGCEAGSPAPPWWEALGLAFAFGLRRRYASQASPRKRHGR